MRSEYFSTTNKDVSYEADDLSILVSGKEFAIKFDRISGDIVDYFYGNKRIFLSGFVPSFLEKTKKHEWTSVWQDSGKQRKLQYVDITHTQKNAVTIESKYSLSLIYSEITYIYTIYQSGEIKVEVYFSPGDEELPIMPKFGSQIGMSQECCLIKLPHDYSVESCSENEEVKSGICKDHHYIVTDTKGCGVEIRAIDAILDVSVSSLRQNDLESKLCDIELRSTMTLNIDLVQKDFEVPSPYGHTFPARELSYSFLMSPISPET